MTTSAESVRQGYDFSCARCGRTWTSDYEVCRFVDAAGAAWEHYRLHGLPATVPVGVSCARCGGLRVRLLAIHPYADRTVAAGHAQPRGAGEDPQQRPQAGQAAARRRVLHALTRVIDGDEERLELVVDGDVRLVLRHGHGGEGTHLRHAMADPKGTRVGDAPALFDPAARIGSIARLVWQRHDEWFLLAGSTDEATLVASAAQVPGLLELLPARLPPRL